MLRSGVIADMLKSFDFSTKGTDAYEDRTGKQSQRTLRFIELSNAYDRIINNSDSTIEPDDELKDDLKNIAEALDGKRFADLEIQQLSAVYDILNKIRHTVINCNKAFTEGVHESISNMGDAVIGEAMGKKDKGKYSGFAATVYDFVNESNVNPIDMFTCIGGTMNKLYLNMRKGFDKHVINMSQAKDFAKGITKDYKVKDWSEGKGKTVKIELTNGRTIEMLPSQIMSFYCLSKREQAIGHILGSGITVAPLDKINNSGQAILKGILAKQLSDHKERIAPQDIEIINSKLTAEQREVADKLQAYMVDVCADWGNETSLRLYGYKKFTEPNYFPIKSSEAFLNENFNNKNQEPSKIKNVGMTKNIIINANNPIVIDDIFNVFTSHVNTMSMYNALVPAITDFERVYNYKQRNADGTQDTTVHDVVEQKYSKRASNYIKKFLIDVNQNYNNVNDHRLFNFFLRKMKQGTLGLNLRVLVQQPTAIVRAATVMDAKWLAVPANLNMVAVNKNMKEMQDHSPIAKWKSWGFYNTDVSRNMRDIFMDKKDISSAIFMDMYGKADDFTWTMIWNGVKKEVAHDNPHLIKGSDEYWQAVNERFSYVVDRTQVVDSVFHRSQIMRNQDTFSKMVTSFMAEPTKTFNMLRTELVLAGQDIQNGNKGKAMARTARVCSVFIANAAAVSAAAALIDALRGASPDDDDKSFEEKWKAYFKKDTWQNVDLFSLLPGLRDVQSLIQDYDVSRMDLDGITKLIKACAAWKKPEYTLYAKLKATAKGISVVTGVPFYNVMRDSESAYVQYNKYAISDSVGSYVKHKTQYDAGNKDNLSKFMADYKQAAKAGDRDSMEYIKNDLIKSGIKESVVKDAITRLLAKANKKAVEKAADSLDVSKIKAAEQNCVDGGMSQGKADDKIKYAVNGEYNDAVEAEDWDRAAKALKTLRKLGYYVYDGKLKGSMRSAYSDYLAAGNTSKANEVLNEMSRRKMFSDDKYYTTKEYTIKQTNRTIGINKCANLINNGNVSSAKNIAYKYCNKYDFEYDAFWDRAKKTAKRLGKK